MPTSMTSFCYEEPWTVLWNNMLHLLPYIICQLCYRRFFFLLWRTPIDTYVAVGDLVMKMFDAC